MWNRIKYILSFFLLMLVYFMLQKPVFMLTNAQKSYAVDDFLNVMWHGSSLDATTAGYLTIIPFVVMVVSIWVTRLPMRKLLMSYYVLVALIVSLVFVGDLSLFAFWESKLDASIFIYIDSPKNVAASVSWWYMLWRFMLIVFLTAIVSYLLWKLTPRCFEPMDKLNRRLLASCMALPLAGVLFVVIRGGVRVSTANVGNVYFSNDQFLNLSAINPVFNLLASTERQAKYEDEFNFYGELERKRLMEGLYATNDSSTVTLLNTRRPNVLVIFMESFGATMIEKMGGAKGVAPNLCRLADEGVFFSNVYASSFRTDRGTVCTFSGFPGLPTLSIMKVANLAQKMPNVAKSLGNAGYVTDFLYGGDINFTNMQGYLRAGGFQKITSQDDFSLSERNFSKWGVPDGITFNRLYELLKQREGRGGKPWFTAFLTLSSHEPFEVPFRKFDDDHYNAFAYTDHCIGEFMARFRKSPMWKNTLVVLLPDHGIPYPKSGERFGPHYFRIPLIWTGGAIKKGGVDVDRIMSQTDLAATLLAQMGIDHRDFKFSRNVLSESYSYPFAFYSFVNGFGFVDASGVSVFDNASGRVFYRENPAGERLRVARGKAILQTLYDAVGDMNAEKFRK